MSIIQLQHASGANVKIHPQGAHITSWQTADGVERLFLSKRAEFRPGVAVRGGVPIVFPQFAALGSLPKHGFARTTQWRKVDSGAQTESDTATFVLSYSPETLAIWPYRFSLRYQVSLGDDELRMQLMVVNDDMQAFAFTAALHTYLRVVDIAAVSVHGLRGCRFRDSAHGNTEHVEHADVVRFAGETDRIYFSTSQPIVVNEPGQRSMRCSAQGFGDTVVWNPGSSLSQKLPDMEDDGYRRMVCIEAAAIEPPVTVLPGGQWQGSQTLKVI